MRLFKKNQHCLFVEEESYNWSTKESSITRRFVVVLTMVVGVGILFSVL